MLNSFLRRLTVELVDACLPYGALAAILAFGPIAVAQSNCHEAFGPGRLSRPQATSTTGAPQDRAPTLPYIPSFPKFTLRKSKLQRYAVTRALLEEDRGADRARRFNKLWAVHSLDDAINRFFPGRDVVAVIDKTKIRYRVENVPFEIVVDPSGHYFRVQNMVESVRGSRDVFVDWTGQPADDVSSHFNLGGDVAVPGLSVDTITTYRRLVRRQTLDWAQLDASEKQALIDSLPYLTNPDHLTVMLRVAGNSGDPAWIPALEELVEGWSQNEMGRTTVWRESAVPRALNIRRYLLKQPTRWPLQDYARASFETRADIVRRMSRAPMNREDLSIALRLAATSSAPMTIDAFLDLAKANGSPEWIVIFDLWSQQLKVSRVPEYAGYAQRVADVRKHILREVVSALDIGSTKPLRANAVSDFVRLAVLTGDTGTLAFLHTLEKMDRFNFAVHPGASYLEHWKSSPEGRLLHFSILDAIRELESA